MKEKILLLLVLMSLLAIPALSQEAKGATNGAMASVTAPQVATSGSSSIANDPDYQIGPGDKLDISVWREPENSAKVPVRPDGKVSLPLLGDVQAAGTTPSKLAATITQRLRQFLTDPRVTVIVVEANSRRVYLIGEVVHPGAIPMLPNMTVLQALSSSGGFSQFAKINKMYVLRAENGKQLKLPVNYKKAISGQSPEDNFILEPGDTIVVP